LEVIPVIDVLRRVSLRIVMALPPEARRDSRPLG
jgi:hypothetical protein